MLLFEELEIEIILCISFVIESNDIFGNWNQIIMKQISSIFMLRSYNIGIHVLTLINNFTNSQDYMFSNLGT